MAERLTRDNAVEFSSLFGCRIMRSGSEVVRIDFLHKGRVAHTAHIDDWIVQYLDRTLEILTAGEFQQRFKFSPADVPPILTLKEPIHADD